MYYTVGQTNIGAPIIQNNFSAIAKFEHSLFKVIALLINIALSTIEIVIALDKFPFAFSYCLKS